jgi:hypothetical protein
VFRQIIPVAVAGVLAAWDVVAPGTSPAGWLVRTLGNPPTGLVPIAAVRLGQGVLAVLCLASIVAAAAGVPTAAWAIAAVVGILGILACILGRPSLGVSRGPGGRLR